MKKIITTVLAASLMLLGTNAFAQLSVGFGFANAETKFNALGIVNAKANLNGFFAGGTYNLKIGQSGLGIAPGIYFSYLTKNDVDLKVTTMDFTETYVGVPVDINFTIPISDGIKGIIYAGPTFSYGISSKGKIGSTEFDLYDGDLKEILTQTTSIDYKRFDVQLGGGIGLELYDMIRFTVGYDFGMMDRGSSILEIKRNRLNVGVAYVF